MIGALRPRRSALYMPASNAKAIAKARSLDADAVIFDLEDAVAPEAKLTARAAALAALAEGGFGHREVVIRINGLDTPWGKDDLAAVAQSPADAVLIPKINTAEDVQAINDQLASAHPKMQLWCMIETCAAVGNLFEIAALASSTRQSTWIMGVNDLAKEMRAKLLPGRAPFLPILSLAVAAARANGLSIIDGVSNEFRDLDVFRAEAEQGLVWGFDGKSLIHPAQIEPCNAIFSPNDAELTWAQTVIEAFELLENQGKGVIQIDGKMVELLHRDDAQRMITLAAQIKSRASAQ